MKTLDKCYIDGLWVPVSGRDSFERKNPTTEEPLVRLKMATAADADQAVKAARRAFPRFSRSSTAERIELLESVIARFTARQAELADIVCTELGAPKSATIHTVGTIGVLNEAVATLKNYKFEVFQGPNLISRDPIGVCALIAAWNWPLQLLGTKVGYALAAGCTMVLKPSEFTPLSAIAFAEILHEAGTPPGVFNLVIGDGATVGNALCAHPEVDMVSFTGSTRAGILVAEAAAPTVKRVSQELGGKSPCVVLPDADVTAAAQWTMGRAFFNTGQSCHAPTRLLVHESQIDEAIAALRKEGAKVQPGDPFDSGTTMGPLINEAQFERVQKYIQIGMDEGAELVCGGLGRPEGLKRGYFAKPTVFARVDPRSKIAQEEVFGPVLALIAYSDVKEAIDIANGTEYGLGAYAFSKDPDAGLALCRQLRAGRVFFNGAASNPAAPMGGYKKSGNGRAMGVFGLEEYLEVKAMVGFAD
ncbi:aldehyde dehydrogenase family protein [Variovorax sp. HJSM1_2]|uniref:aldehyde dehydrogenase family protein n=1 Tax=Variovorax sp. HJSM1_2 TaxID=3366263 RepID=UPI003BC66D59